MRVRSTPATAPATHIQILTCNENAIGDLNVPIFSETQGISVIFSISWGALKAIEVNKIKIAINQLLENLKIYESQNKKLEPAAAEEVKVDEKETEQQQIKKAAETKTTRFDRKPSIKKKFRY